MILYKTGQLTSSEAELNRALTLDPHAIQAYYCRAQVLDHKGEPQRAIEDLETAIALEPGFLDAYSGLAKIYSAQGQVKKAVAMLDAANKLEQSEPSSARHRDMLLRELSAPLP
jgi:tetratricopeptide (TPR) repeat protein